MSVSVQCPKCNSTLKAREQSAGKALPCPKCGNYLLVPQAAAPSAALPELVLEAPQTNRMIPATPPPPRPVPVSPFAFDEAVEEEVPQPARRERQQIVIQNVQAVTGRGDGCPYCGSNRRTVPGGREINWGLFVILLIFFFPLCWIPLVTGERTRICPNCRRRC